MSRRLLHPAALALLAACGGEGAKPVSPDTSPRRVAASVDSVGMAVYDTLRLTAVARTADGRPLPEAPLAWSSSDSRVVRVAGGGGLEAVGTGEALVVVAAGTAAGAPADTVRVRVRAAAAATLEVSPSRLILGVGVRVPLAVVARDRRGGLVDLAASPPVLSASASTVDVAGGVIRGAQAGTATVTVAVGALRREVAVVVVPDFALALASTALAPTDTVTAWGTGLAGARVSVAGAPATVLGGTDTSVVFTVPTAPFQPCRAAGPVELTVTRAAGTARAGVPSPGAPFALALAPGAHAIPVEALAAGCELAVAAAGEYVVMPFAWDRATSGAYVPGAPVPARLSVLPPLVPGQPTPPATMGATLAALARATGARSQGVPAVPRARQAGLPPDVVDLAGEGAAPTLMSPRALAGPAAGGSCAIPLTPGATVPLGTIRVNGIVQQVRRTVAAEPWVLAAATPAVAVFWDSTMARVANGNAAVAGRLARFVAAFDTTVVPLMARYTDGIPDGDGNGRVVVLMPYIGPGFAYALPNGYGRPDCPDDASGGEAILVPSPVLLTPGAGGAVTLNFPTAMALTAHEVAHLVDHKGPLVTRESSAWTSEGFAMQFNWLWAAGPDVPDPYSGNRPSAFVRLLEGAGTGYSCVEPQRAAFATLTGPGGVPYTTACAYVRAVVARGVRRGLSPREALMRFVALRRRYTFTSAVNEYDGTARRPQDLVGEWLLSWYADDHVAGTAPELQDPAMQWRTAYHSAWPLPERQLAVGDSLDLLLGDPDVYHYVAALPALARVRFVQPNGFAGALSARATVAVLRVR